MRVQEQKAQKNEFETLKVKNEDSPAQAREIASPPSPTRQPGWGFGVLG